MTAPEGPAQYASYRHPPDVLFGRMLPRLPLRQATHRAVPFRVVPERLL
ncbi:hypothetical protein SMG44B_40382 [Stenotrophomonas maltophilia]